MTATTSKVAVTGLPRGARFYRADLHVHSFGGSHDVKDASTTPEQIVQRAIDEGLDVVAIADHNEISNVQAAIDAAAGRLLLVPAVELQAREAIRLASTLGRCVLSERYARAEGRLRARFGE